MVDKVKVAAIQMTAAIGEVERNLKRAEALVEEAFALGSRWVILPEFFTCPVAFHPDLLEAALPLEGPAKEMLCRQAVKHGGYVGGSFIASREGDRYNTFVLAYPEGGYALHDKDQPTMWENCYYLAGNDDGILETPDGPVGAAVCWEMVRTRTVARMRGKIQLLVAGSNWWTVPDWPIPPFYWSHLDKRNEELMEETPARLARLLGVPVIHAAHAGEFKAGMPLMPGIPYSSRMLGETQIVDAHGGVLARMRREDGEGIITAELELGAVEPTEDLPDRFWIPRLPLFFRAIWTYQNIHGANYYQRMKRAGRLKVD